MSNIASNTTKSVTVPANHKLEVKSLGLVQVFEVKTYTNFLPSRVQVGEVHNGSIELVFTADADLEIVVGREDAEISIGSDPALPSEIHAVLKTPLALDVTGDITPNMVLGGLITSTTASPVSGTLPEGADLEAASSLPVGYAYVWSIINTGSEDFTVVVNTDHTFVGEPVVVKGSSAQFYTRKSGPGVFTTFRS